MASAKIANLTLCYEGVQRTYRNTILTHIRKHLSAAFPTDLVSKVKRPFQKEWDLIKAAAEERRKTGELATPLKDELDILGVNHFFNLFDAYAEILIPAIAGTDEDRKKAKKALLGWMQNIKALRDPLSHPGESDLTFEDAFVLLDCARRVLTQLGYADEARRVYDLSRQLAGRQSNAHEDEIRPPLEARLPARESVVVRFVGRSGELLQLRKWFDDPLSKRWALVGAGGLGKSALAYAFAEEVHRQAPEPFQAVIWLSAKVRRYSEGQIVPISDPDFCDLDTALNRLLLLYGWHEDIALPLETKRTKAIELLNSFPALVVVDDVDSLEGSGEDAIEFFTITVAQTRSKVLLTSRRTILGLGHTATLVGGLPDPDAESFIKSRYALLELDESALTGSAIKGIAEAAGGSPLYMEDLVRLTAVMPLQQAIAEWKLRGGDEARRYALGRELEKLSYHAVEVLAAACMLQRAATYEELRLITGHSPEALATSLGELQKLFLVPKPQLIDGEDRYDVGVNTRSLVRTELEHTDRWRRLQNAYFALTGDVRLRQGKNEIGALCRKAVLLVRTESNSEAEALLKAGLEKHPNNTNLLSYLGFVYKAWRPPRRTDARERFARAHELKSRDPEMYKHWISMELKDQEWGAAYEAAMKGLEYLPESPLLNYYAGYSQSRLGREISSSIDADKATKALKKAQSHLEKGLALAIPPQLNQSVRRDLFRAQTLNWERLAEPKRVFEVIENWRREFPDDPDLATEFERLKAKFGALPGGGMIG